MPRHYDHLQDFKRNLSLAKLRSQNNISGMNRPAADSAPDGQIALATHASAFRRVGRQPTKAQEGDDNALVLVPHPGPAPLDPRVLSLSDFYPEYNPRVVQEAARRFADRHLKISRHRWTAQGQEVPRRKEEMRPTPQHKQADNDWGQWDASCTRRSWSASLAWQAHCSLILWILPGPLGNMLPQAPEPHESRPSPKELEAARQVLAGLFRGGPHRPYVPESQDAEERSIPRLLQDIVQAGQGSRRAPGHLLQDIVQAGQGSRRAPGHLLQRRCPPAELSLILPTQSVLAAASRRHPPVNRNSGGSINP